MTLAAIDRLVHHVIILDKNVESYRRKPPSIDGEVLAGGLFTPPQTSSAGP